MKWQAQWIWIDEDAGAGGEYAYAHARKTFTLSGRPCEARLHVCANHIYRLYVNGKHVGRGPDRSDPRYPYYDTYDVAPWCRRGRNAITLDLYAILPGNDRGRAWCLYGGEPGLLLQMRYRTRAGDRARLLKTDRTWKMLPSPCWRAGAERISRFLGFVEHFDARAARAIEGYTRPEYDDSAWPRPALLGKPPDGPLGPPLAREIPPLMPVRRPPVGVGSIQHGDIRAANETAHLGIAPVHPNTVTAPPGRPTGMTFDFGRTMGGMLEAIFENCSGGRVEIFYGDSQRRQCQEIVELPESGRLRFESLEWRGARFALLLFHDVPRPLTLRSVSFIEQVYPFSRRGAFDADEPLPGDIWDICRRTAATAVKDHPQDCVTREQALWLEDLLPHVQACAVCFNDLRPFEKAVRQTLRTITPGGVAAVPGPVALGYAYEAPLLRWSLQPLFLPRIIAAIHEHTGDEGLAAESAAPLLRLARHFAAYEDRRGLLDLEKPGMQALQAFGGWSAMLKTGVATVANVQYVEALSAMEGILRLAGCDAEAGRVARRLRRTRAALKAHFYDREAHLFVDGEQGGRAVQRYSPAVNGAAVVAGLLPEGEEGAWALAMERHPDMAQLRSAYDASIVLESYFRLGRDDLARLLLDRCWGAFARRNEPAVPERWTPHRRGSLVYDLKCQSSYCHPYGAGPAWLMMRYVAGIRPLAPGYRAVAIAPQAMGLRLVRARMTVPAGEIEVFWRRHEHAWRLEVVLPPGVEASVTLPRFGWAAGRMKCDGRIVWEDDGWRRIEDESHRRRNRDTVREVRATLVGAGRHVVEMRAL